MNHSRALLKTLALSTLLIAPSCGGGGGGGSSLPVADPIQSSFSVDVPFGTSADGIEEVQLDLVVVDRHGVPLEGVELEFLVSGFSNQILQPALTDENGHTSGSLSTTVGELKSVQAVVLSGARSGQLASLDTEFVRLVPNTYFVRQSGSDGRAGDAPLEAWASLSYAFDQLQPGDTLHVGAGTYASARITVVGTDAQPVHVLADTNGHETGDAGVVAIDAIGTDYGVYFDGACHVTMRGFSIYNALPGSEYGGALWVGDATSLNLSFLDCALFENTRGIEVQRSGDLTVEGCSISNNREDGIRLGLTSDASILNNLIYNNEGSGVNIVKLTGGLTVGLNTFSSNLGPHLAENLPAGSEGASAFVTGNLFTDGGDSSVRVGSTSSGLFLGDVNLAFGNLADPSDLPVIGESIEADPLLQDVDGPDNVLGGFGHQDDDFSLSVGSAAIDAGTVDSNQVTLSSSGPAAAKSSTMLGLLDGQGSDGARLNLGYHSPGRLEDYRSALPSEARVSFASADDAYVRTSLRSSALGQWSGQQDAQLTNSGAKWLIHRLAPAGPEEVMATLVDTGLETELYVRHWDGRGWSENLDFPVIRSFDRANVGERGFDLAYEQASGDALFVYSDNDSNPIFRSLTKGVWSTAAPVFGSALGTGTVLWVELIPDANSDRIALIALDEDQSLTSAIWNGQSWESPVLLGTQSVTIREFNSFAGAWESLSGDFIAVWGFSIFAEQARYAVLDAGTGIWSPTQLYTNSEAVGALVRMQSDPESDRIAMAWSGGNVENDVVVSTWDGDRFTETRELTFDGEAAQQLMQVGWIGSTGKAFAIYRLPNLNSFERARFDTFWKFEAAISVPQMGSAVRAEINSNAGADFAEVVILDSNGSLFGFEVRFEGVGTQWTLMNDGLPLAQGLSADKSTQLFAANWRALL